MTLVRFIFNFAPYGHGLDPFAWLRVVLDRLPLLRAAKDSIPDEHLRLLLPNVWTIAF